VGQKSKPDYFYGQRQRAIFSSYSVDKATMSTVLRTDTTQTLNFTLTDIITSQHCITEDTQCKTDDDLFVGLDQHSSVVVNSCKQC